MCDSGGLGRAHYTPDKVVYIIETVWMHTEKTMIILLIISAENSDISVHTTTTLHKS